MNDRNEVQATRRRLLTGGLAAAGTLLSGCDRLSRADWVQRTLGQAERWSLAAHRWLVSAGAMAREYPPAAIAPQFRANGTTNPRDADYRRLAANGFADWRLTVDGLVDNPLTLSLDDLRGMPARTQITRHDCVEGWSCIGQWTGAVLGAVLDSAGVQAGAKYAVFHCMDRLGGRDLYYESLDLTEAYHPQTLLAYELNGATLPVANGAPLRLRAERQLGYKMAKYLQRIELVADFGRIHGGNGGYWEDRGYNWYAGI